jgi:hypothetical protein
MTVSIDISNDEFEILEKTHDNFATAPIDIAFNWDMFAKKTKLHDWYLVAFRSTRKPDADLRELEYLDELAHQDAASQPGFLYYYKGKIMEGATHTHNLSFCMWTDRESAKAAAMRSMHRQASNIALKMYDQYNLERYIGKINREGHEPKVEFTAV